MHSKNTTSPSQAQATLRTTGIKFGETPIDNRGECLFQTVPGMAAEDAIQQARILSSGLSQISQGMHEYINYGGLVHCDGMMVIGFLADAINALVCSVQSGVSAPESQEAGQ